MAYAFGRLVDSPSSSALHHSAMSTSSVTLKSRSSISFLSIHCDRLLQLAFDLDVVCIDCCHTVLSVKWFLNECVCNCLLDCPAARQLLFYGGVKRIHRAASSGPPIGIAHCRGWKSFPVTPPGSFCAPRCVPLLSALLSMPSSSRSAFDPSFEFVR